MTSENHKTNRTKPLGLKVSEDFYWEVKALALKEKHSIVETIENSVHYYKQHQTHTHTHTHTPKTNRKPHAK